MSRQRTRFPGVYQRQSETRRFDGKPDLCFDITYKQDGKKIWEKVGWRSEGYSAAMAAEIRSERMREMRHPGLIQKRGSCQVLSEAWRDYDESVVSQQKNPKTDRCRWSIHIVDKLGHIPLDSIDSKTMQSFKNQLESSNLSPQSVKHVLALIRRVINRSIRTETWSGRNPICLIDMPRVDNKRERFLMPDEAKALLASVRRRSDQWYRIALLSLHTGMRAGEIFALDGDRVDLGNRLARVVDGKTGSRWVHLTETACRVLRESGPLVPGEPVFKSRGGQRISVVSCTFDRAVDELKLNAGISDRRARIVFHSLRHTYASWLAMSNVPILTISRLLGHFNTTTTQRYAHLCPEAERSAVEHIEALFNGGHPQSSPDATPEKIAGLFEGIE